MTHAYCISWWYCMEVRLFPFLLHKFCSVSCFKCPTRADYSFVAILCALTHMPCSKKLRIPKVDLAFLHAPTQMGNMYLYKLWWADLLFRYVPEAQMRWKGMSPHLVITWSYRFCQPNLGLFRRVCVVVHCSWEAFRWKEESRFSDHLGKIGLFGYRKSTIPTGSRQSEIQRRKYVSCTISASQLWGGRTCHQPQCRGSRDIRAFTLELQTQASRCNFGDWLEIHLWDSLFSGINNQ